MIGVLWRQNEIALVDAAIEAGLLSTRCEHMFPDRTPDAVRVKFQQRRRMMGLPSIIGRPRKTRPVPVISPTLRAIEPEPMDYIPPAEHVASARLYLATVAMFERSAKRSNISVEQAARRMLAPVSAAAMEAAA